MTASDQFVVAGASTREGGERVEPADATQPHAVSTPDAATGGEARPDASPRRGDYNARRLVPQVSRRPLDGEPPGARGGADDSSNLRGRNLHQGPTKDLP